MDQTLQSQLSAFLAYLSIAFDTIAKHFLNIVGGMSKGGYGSVHHRYVYALFPLMD